MNGLQEIDPAPPRRPRAYFARRPEARSFAGQVSSGVDGPSHVGPERWQSEPDALAGVLHFAGDNMADALRCCDMRWLAATIDFIEGVGDLALDTEMVGGHGTENSHPNFIACSATQFCEDRFSVAVYDCFGVRRRVDDAAGPGSS